jgi:hypothetical protein
MMNLFFVLNVVWSEIAYTAGSLVGSLVVCFGLLWIFVGLNPRQVFYQIEHKDNGAVGLVFAGFCLITSMAVGFAFSDPQTEGTLRESFLWLFGGLLLASIYYALVSGFVLWIFSRDNDLGDGVMERPRAFLKREIITDKNVGLMGFLVGLAFACYIPVILITIK